MESTDITSLIVIGLAVLLFGFGILILILGRGKKDKHTKFHPPESKRAAPRDLASTQPATPKQPTKKPAASEEESLPSPYGTMLPDEILQDVNRLLAQGKKIEAIKRLRESTDWGLRECKAYVDALAAGEEPPQPSTPPSTAVPYGTALPHELLRTVYAQLDVGRKISAIKIVREATGWGLKESKEYVEALAYAKRPAKRPSPSLPHSTKLPEELIHEARTLVARGRKIDAVERVQRATGWDLKKSKAYVEALPTARALLLSETSSPYPIPYGAELPSNLLQEVGTLLARGRKIEAIKRVREETGWGLKESKEYVESLIKP